MVEMKTMTVPAFLNVGIDGKEEYMNVAAVLNDKELHRRALTNAVKELVGVYDEYSFFPEVKALICEDILEATKKELGITEGVYKG